MAVTLKGQTAVYEGVSTDTKPTDADNNAIFKELDTGIRYYYDGANWNEIPSSGGGGGGTGTDNYNELNHKPSINGTVLSGNKSLDNLGIQAKLTFDNAPTSGSSNPVKSGGVYSALESKQDTISDLSTIQSGAAAGATAVQPQAMEQALAAKQDTLNSEQLAAVNSGITADIVSADTAALIELVDSGAKNLLEGAEQQISDTRSVSFNISIPPGKYVIYVGEYESTDTDDTRAQAYFFDDSSNIVSTRFIQQKANGMYQEVTVSAQTARVTIYASDNASHGANDTVTVGKVMVCTKAAWDISQTYQPYRPAYQELYERVLALENA